MAGLTTAGFVPEVYEDIKARIEQRMEAFNPGFDFSPDSPDGQLIGIFGYEIFLCWQQLNEVYNSYNPQVASGAALRNLGLITGLEYGVASRSTATVELTGTTGVIIPAGTLVADDDGNEFYFSFDTTIPSSAPVAATIAGSIPITAGTITTIVNPIAGWTAVSQATDGLEGKTEQTEQQFRNTRQETVMRGYVDTVESMQSALVELGIGSVLIYNNDTAGTFEGVPPYTIHVQLGEIPAGVTDAIIAKTILDRKSMGTPTFGSTTTATLDSQGVSHDVSFTKSIQVPCSLVVDVTYLSDNTAGAEDNIKQALVDYFGNLNTGDDVIWSRLFGVITPYAKAQVNVLTVGESAGSQAAANVVIDPSEYASLDVTDITFTST